MPSGSKAALILRRAALSLADVAARTESTSVERIERACRRNKKRSGTFVLIWTPIADWFIYTYVQGVVRR